MVKIEWDVKLGFRDILIRPKRSALRSRKDVKLLRKYSFKHAKFNWEGIPIMAANMDTVGTFEMAKAFANQKCMVALHKHYTINEWKNFLSSEMSLNTNGNGNNCQTNGDLTLDTNEIKNDLENVSGNDTIFNFIAVSSGTSDHDFQNLCTILHLCPSLKFICLDVANGYSEHFVKYVVKVRLQFPHHCIIAGNVVTGEMTEQLILSGADIVKVGIGPGSVCTTRKKTGVGYPQLSAVLECADAAHGLGGLIISDGGCTMPGDFSKAFGAGADFVMAGGMFSGFDESGGDLVEDEYGRKFKQFYGMSSAVAMKKYSNKTLNNYRASEGKCVMVPYRGCVGKCLETILGGIRSTCTYVGAGKLKELTKRTTFIRVNQHHNIIFGDENNSSYDLKQRVSKYKNVNRKEERPSIIDSNDDLHAQKQTLLKYLTDTMPQTQSVMSSDRMSIISNAKSLMDEEIAANDSLSGSTNLSEILSVNILDALSVEMKNEFFEWLREKKVKENGGRVSVNGNVNGVSDGK